MTAVFDMELESTKKELGEKLPCLVTFPFNPALRSYQEGLRKVILHGTRISKIFPAGYQSFEKKCQPN